MLDSKTVAYQAVMRGFSHQSFSDLDFFRRGEVNGIAGEESIRLQRLLIRTFFDRYLKGVEIELGNMADDHERISITSHVK